MYEMDYSQTTQKKSTSLLVKISSIGLSLLILAGCQTKGIEIETVVAPRNDAALKVKRLAILPFSTQGGVDSGISNFVEAKVAEGLSTGRGNYELVSRDKVDLLRNEIRMKANGELDLRGAASKGRLYGIDTVLTGQVSPLAKQSRSNSHQVTECNAGKPGKIFSRCTSTSTRSVTCTDTSASVTVTAKAIRLETGQVIYGKPVSGATSYSFCDGTASVDDASLYSAAVTNALMEIVRDIAPTRVVFVATLKQSPEGLSPRGQERFRGALAFANSRRFDRACEIFRELEQSDVNTLPVLYNVAACHEFDGNLPQALAMITTLDRRLDSPDADVNAALNRLKGRIASEQQLRTATPGQIRK